MLQDLFWHVLFDLLLTLWNITLAIMSSKLSCNKFINKRGQVSVG
jgi:hypothetical protein